MKSYTSLFLSLILFSAFSSTAQTITSDDFNGFNLNTNIWSFTDPNGDATLTVTGTNTTDARVVISIPGGIPHDIWTAGNQTPRITQPAPNSDFTLQTKFESPESLAYQIQGILVEASPTDFLRFDFYSDGAGTRMFAAHLAGSTPTLHADMSVGSNGIQTLYMRIARSGDVWTQSFSLDGTTWTDTTFTQALIVTKIGLYVGNAPPLNGTSPAHTVTIDYFQNNASPIVSEDGETSVIDTLKPLIYNTNAAGSSSSFVVNWKTDEAANGRIEYGLTTAYELTPVIHGNYLTQHSLPVNGLQPATTFHYRIISADNGGRADTTADSTVSTTEPFTLSDIQTFTTSGSATITWTTSGPTTSRIVYGATTAYGDTLLDSALVTSHFLNVTGLSATTLYHFKTSSSDSFDITISSNDSTFTTASPTTLQEDEFNDASLNSLKWTFSDLAADATQTMTGTQLSIAIPSGSTHNVWDIPNNAPRILQTCNNADFEITLKFDAGMSQRFQIQGLIVEQNATNFIRFDFNSDGPDSTKLFAATFTNNVPTIRLNELPVDTNNAAPMYMRITRQGALWTQEYSANGTTWTTAISFNHLLTVSSVAVFIGNSDLNPAFTGLVDYFRLSSAPSNSVTANLKAILEGAYDVVGDTMRTDIRALMPVNQPYASAPWNYAGNESVSGIPSDVVDWILLDLRTTTDSSGTVARRAAFLKKDGSIVDTSGTGAVIFVNVNSGNYYVVIHQRNHIPIMSAAPITLSQSSGLYDFRSSSGQAFGTLPLKEMATNRWALYSGDANASYIITAADANVVFGVLNQTNYNLSDVNLSGIVSAADANIVFGNLNKTSQVP